MDSFEWKSEFNRKLLKVRELCYTGTQMKAMNRTESSEIDPYPTEQ